MARKGILYKQVTDAITTLQKSQQKITVRAIHALTGGSMSTVLKHYRRWQSEQLGHNPESTEISTYLSEALHNELRNYARRALLSMESRLSSKDEKLKQVEAAYQQAQCDISNLNKTLNAIEKNTAPAMCELEKQLQMALRGRTKAEDQLQRMSDQTKAMEDKLAEADTRLKTLSRELLMIQKQMHESQVCGKKLEQRLEQAEKRARQAEEQLQKRRSQDNKSRPQRTTPAPTTPATDAQQKTFEF